jgi:hypothetical protein
LAVTKVYDPSQGLGGSIARPLAMGSRDVGLEVGVDNLPRARVNPLKFEMLIGGAGRDGLKPPGLGSNYLGKRRLVPIRSITGRRNSEIAKVG